VIVVVEENHGFQQIIGSDQAPFLNMLARHATLLTAYRAITHPSLPNYIAMVSGGTRGLASDCTSCHVAARNLADQLDKRGLSWKAYMQGLPAPCSDASHAGAYVKTHNPFLYFDDISGAPGRCRDVVPFDEFTADLASGRLPGFAFISPDLNHDMHNGPVRLADAWLRKLYGQLRASPVWEGNTRLVVTFDEGTPGGNRVVTIIAGPHVPSARDDTGYTHYSLLRSIEAHFGLPYLGHAGDPGTAPIRALIGAARHRHG
jgi:phospholipase C